MAKDDLRWIEFLSRIADRTDPIAMRHFRSSDLMTVRKADRSIVSEADRAIEDTVREVVHGDEPTLGFLGEESGESPGAAGSRIICDPIDGTENFVSGIPIFATLLGIEVGEEIVAGLVSAPALGLRWHAARGHGAFCGPRLLRVSDVGAMERSQVFHSDLRFVNGLSMPPGLPLLIARCRRSRGFGDFYQHLLVAEGAGEVAVDPVMKPWDISPLQVIIEEAGGRATTLDGERSIYGGSLVSSNGIVHAEALDILRSQAPI